MRVFRAVCSLQVTSSAMSKTSREKWKVKQQVDMVSMINEAVEVIFSSHCSAIIRACRFPSYPPHTKPKQGKKRRVALQQDPRLDSDSEEASPPPTKRSRSKGGSSKLLSLVLARPMMIWIPPHQPQPLRTLSSRPTTERYKMINT